MKTFAENKIRTFVVSDIHGFANLYYPIMQYLDNISKEKRVELYINGDLIGYQSVHSADILLDVMKRIQRQDPNFHITYLGGDQEFLMSHAFYNLGEDGNGNDWYRNGGRAIFNRLADRIGERKTKEEVRDFIYNLHVYQEFKKKLDGKKIIIVHAARPFFGGNNLTIGEMGNKVYYVVSGKKNCPSPFPMKRANRENEITILGNNPVSDKKGFDYDVNKRELQIDGGASRYLLGQTNYNHFPLVELEDNFFRILTFNDKKDIACGYYLGVDNFMQELSPSEIEKEKSNIKM